MTDTRLTSRDDMKPTIPPKAPDPMSPRGLPKLAGVSGAIDKLLHGLEARAEKFMTRIEGTEARADNVFTKAGEKLSAADGQLDTVDQYLDALEGSNSAPTSPVSVRLPVAGED